jgi:hypothetical protein
VRCIAPEIVEEAKSVSVLETDIEKDGVEVAFGKLSSCIFDPACGKAIVAGVFERERERLANRAIVVDDEDAW